MKIYDLIEKQQYIEEFVMICHNEWGTPWKDEEKESKLQKKIKATLDRLVDWPTLIMLDNNKLVGFVSLFKYDLEETNLTPWYATLYVKPEYRGMNTSKMLTEEIIKCANSKHFEKLYLKTTLINFYEKFGFKYLKTLPNGEKLYYINLNY